MAVIPQQIAATLQLLFGFYLVVLNDDALGPGLGQQPLKVQALALRHTPQLGERDDLGADRAPSPTRGLLGRWVVVIAGGRDGRG